MEQPKSLLSGMYSRLKLKDVPLSTFSSASDEQMDELFQELKSIEPLIERSHQLQAVLKQCPRLSAFLDHCCQSRWYSFCIKKCGAQSCNICRPPHLVPDAFRDLHHLPDPVPDASGDHYKLFKQRCVWPSYVGTASPVPVCWQARPRHDIQPYRTDSKECLSHP